MILARIRIPNGSDIAELIEREQHPPFITDTEYYFVRFLSDGDTGLVPGDTLLAVWEDGRKEGMHMTPEETAAALVNDHFYGAPYMSEYEKPRLAAAIAAALRAYGDARAAQERERCAQAADRAAQATYESKPSRATARSVAAAIRALD